MRCSTSLQIGNGLHKTLAENPATAVRVSVKPGEYHEQFTRTVYGMDWRLFALLLLIKAIAAARLN